MEHYQVAFFAHLQQVTPFYISPDFILDPSIPYSQYLRVCRNCSSDSSFKMEADALRDRLLARGYSKTCLRKAYKCATVPSGQTLLYARKMSKAFTTIWLITHYCGQHHQIKRIMDKYWHLLGMDTEISPLVSEKPAITNRRAKSLKDKLVNREFKGAARKDPC